MGAKGNEGFSDVMNLGSANYPAPHFVRFAGGVERLAESATPFRISGSV